MIKSVAMKNLILSLVILFLLISCRDYYEGQYVVDSFDVPYFDYIESHQSEDIEINACHCSPFIEIVAPESLIDRFRISVQDNTLLIDTRGSVRGETKVSVFTPSISGVYNYGSSDITSFDFIPNRNRLEVYNDGSGDIKLDVDNRESIITINGSGDIDLYGTSDFLSAEIHGSGDIDADQFYALEAEISSEGSGDARLRVADYLRAWIYGSGDIILRGNPVVDLTDEGSGELRF